MKTTALDKEKASLLNQSGNKRNAYVNTGEVKETNLYKSKVPTYDLELAKIVDRPNNEFEMEAIDVIAESIRERGQLDPILVKDLHNGSFEIVAGHRRVAGFRLLFEEAKRLFEESNDPKYKEDMDRFSFVRGSILSKDEDDFWAYLETNYEHRQNSFLTAMKHMDFLIRKLRNRDDQDFLKRVFKNEPIPKNINLAKALFIIFNEKLRIKDVSETTIARFLAVRNGKNEKLKEAMIKGVIPPTVAWKIHSNFTLTQQDALIDAYGSDTYESLKNSFEIENSSSKKKTKKKTFSKSTVSSFRKKFVKEVKPEAVEKANQLFDELEALLNG